MVLMTPLPSTAQIFYASTHLATRVGILLDNPLHPSVPIYFSHVKLVLWALLRAPLLGKLKLRARVLAPCDKAQMLTWHRAAQSASPQGGVPRLQKLETFFFGNKEAASFSPPLD